MHEINLLPPERRQSLRRTSIMISINQFLGSIVLSLWLITGAAGLTIASFWGMSYIAAGATNAQFLQTLQLHQTLQQKVNKQNAFLNYIQTLGTDQFLWSTFLQQFFAAIPPGVSVATMSGSLDGTTLNKPLTSGQLLFTGQAIARNTLTIFTDRLQTLIPEVTQVEAPNTNLIQRDNPTYSFKLTLKQSKTANQTQPQPPQP